MTKLLIWPAVDPERLAQIRAAAGLMEVVNAESEEGAAAAIVDSDAMFGKLTPDLLARAAQLRWVQSPTASLEHYIFPELVEHAAELTNMQGLFSDVIADHVLGYVLCFARNLHVYLRNQIAARWAPCGGEAARTSFAAGPGQVSEMDRAHRHLADDTLGIVGLGHIGREVARRARAFSMRVVAYDPHCRDEPEDVQRLAELPELLAAADFVVIAAPHTPETEGLFRREQLRQMKSTAVLINIGRGAIVDLNDLVDGLKAGDLAGAALDVFETEPLPAEHPLWRMEQAILTPHVAACSTRIAERHLQVLLDNLRRFNAGEPLRNVVNKRLWF